MRDNVSYRHVYCKTVAVNSNDFEVTVIELCNLRMFLLCIPPSLNSSSLLNIRDWLLVEVDNILTDKPSHRLFIYLFIYM